MKTTWGTWTSTRQVRVLPLTTIIGEVEEKALWTMRTSHHHSRVTRVSKLSHRLQLPTLARLLSPHSTWLPRQSRGTHHSQPWRRYPMRPTRSQELPPSPEVRKSIPLSVRGWVGNLDIYSHLAAPTFLCVRGSQLKQSLNKIRHFINITPQCARFNRKYLAILKNRKITTEWEKKKKKMSTSRWQRCLFDKDFFIFFNV